jgi:hypothetical protein
VRRTVRLLDRDPARAAALDELVAEAALADARLGHDANDLRIARRRPCQRGLQRRGLLLPPDEAREAAHAGHVELRAQGPRAFELVHAERVADTLHRERPEIAQAEVARDERRRVLGEVHPVGAGKLLHAGGKPTV